MSLESTSESPKATLFHAEEESRRFNQDSREAVECLRVWYGPDRTADGESLPRTDCCRVCNLGQRTLGFDVLPVVAE